MAVMAFFVGKISKEQYDTIRREINWEGNPPAGVLSHAASFDDTGQAHVADVWESPEQMNDFAQKTLMPAFARHNIPPLSVTVYPLYNLNAYKGLAKYQV